MTGRTASRLQPEGFSVNRLPISQPENLRNHVGLAPVIIQDAGTIVAKCRERAPEIRPEDGWCKRPPRTPVDFAVFGISFGYNRLHRLPTPKSSEIASNSR